MVFRYKNQRIEMPAQLPQIPAVIVTPDAIFYGGNGANNEDREVRFDYEPRVDAVTRFAQGGLPLVASTRLKGITTYAQGRAVKQYRVEYESETRSLITAIFECAGVGGGAICKPPTKFEYVNDVGFEGPLPARAAADGAQFDVNGDGIPDFFATTATVDGVRAQPLATAAFVGADIAVGVGSMYVPPPGVGALAVNVAWALAKVVLFDVLAPVPKVTYSTDIEIGSALRGGVFQSVTSNIQPCLGSTFFVDFDQDGKDEIGTVCGSNSFIAVRSLGDGNFGPFTQANVDLPPLNSMLPRPLMLDVNGDALQDLVSCSSASRLEVRLRRSPSEGFEAPLVFSGRSTPDPHNTGTLFLERVPFCGDALPSFSFVAGHSEGRKSGRASLGLSAFLAAARSLASLAR